MSDQLRPQETELVGLWIDHAGKVRGDAVCDRIERLVQSHLKQIAFDPVVGAWQTLFIDPTDGRFWERTYPHSEWHGGGPPKLATISKDAALERYGREIMEALDA